MSIPYFRGWVLQGLSQTIATLGGDVDAYADRFQLPLRLERDADAPFPGDRLVRLLEACAAELSCPDFGMRAGFAQGRDALGPIALVALHCATVGEAIEAIARYLNLLNSALELQLLNTRSGSRVSYELKVLRAGPTRQIEEWTLAVGLRVLRVIASDQARPKAIRLPHAPLLSLAYYTKFFGCPVRFSQAGYGIELFATDLKRPMLRNDPELKNLISGYIEKIADSAANSFRDQIDLMVRKLLPTGRCTLDTVAGHFYVSVRTLQRRLEQERLVFEDLVETARREGAEQYLVDPAVRMSVVAGLLGYGTQSSFSHAFKRWHGVSPREWRKQRLLGGQ
ncbi:transcriptional regulator, AraC family [Burkholderia sp. GAS332]|jgi:AraC-like DNA-binding protein|uniref:AraC family transcriptional regulator n=1 Tax=Paraburkholderia TaxID=1822464 RepID=UPI00092BF520|nr:transcriptional regulator, AraC family [Burkholderia sp. GAS332]